MRFLSPKNFEGIKMKKILIFSLTFCIVWTASLSGANALKITLKRVVFEGPKRTEVLTLINGEDSAVTYRIGWRHYLMTEEESLVFIDDDAPLPPALKPVTDMVRFAPRRVTIPPRSSQQIRLMLRTPADLAEGEYRSHLWIRPEADIEQFKKEAAEKLKDKGQKTGVTIKMLAGVTMPVIVRKGALTATANIENLVVSQTQGFVNAAFTIRRIGNRSLYGDIDFVCNNGGYLLHTVKGIALYDEVGLRNFNMKIEKELDEGSCDSLTVQYYATGGFLDRNRELLSETTEKLTPL